MKKLFALVIAIQLFVYLSAYRYGFAFPAEVSVLYPMQSGRFGEFGGAVFAISRKTSDAIQSRGLSFFKEIQYPMNKRYRFGEWKQTPVTFDTSGDGTFSSVLALTGESWYSSLLLPNLFKKIIASVNESGGYYAELKRDRDDVVTGGVVILPGLQILICIFPFPHAKKP